MTSQSNFPSGIEKIKRLKKNPVMHDPSTFGTGAGINYVGCFHKQYLPARKKQSYRQPEQESSTEKECPGPDRNHAMIPHQIGCHNPPELRRREPVTIAVKFTPHGKSSGSYRLIPLQDSKEQGHTTGTERIIPYVRFGHAENDPVAGAGDLGAILFAGRIYHQDDIRLEAGR